MGMEVDDPKDRLSLAEAQYAATSTIFGSNDPVEILNALINFSGRPFTYAHLGLLGPEADILNDHRRPRRKRRPRRALSAAAGRVSRLRDARSGRGTRHPGRQRRPAAESARARVGYVARHGVAADHSAGGVAAADRLESLFENPTPVTLSQETLRAMRNLGNQIAVVFENQSLLRDTAATLEEVQTLYDINRAIIGALDPLDVLRVLRSYLAQNAVSIIHAVVERTGGGESVVVRHIISATGEQTVELPIENVKRAADMFGEGELTGVDPRRRHRQRPSQYAAARAAEFGAGAELYRHPRPRAQHDSRRDRHCFRVAGRPSTAGRGACTTPLPTRSASCCKINACCKMPSSPLFNWRSRCASCRRSTSFPPGLAPSRRRRTCSITSPSVSSMRST